MQPRYVAATPCMSTSAHWLPHQTKYRARFTSINDFPVKFHTRKHKCVMLLSMPDIALVAFASIPIHLLTEFLGVCMSGEASVICLTTFILHRPTPLMNTPTTLNIEIVKALTSKSYWFAKRMTVISLPVSRKSPCAARKEGYFVFKKQYFYPHVVVILCL